MITNTIITENDQTKQKLLNGINLLANTVKVTLGAKGKTVMFNDDLNRVLITKDGVTVAKNVRSNDPIENLAIKIVKEAAEKTVKTSGDGTTTTIVLAQYIINEAFKLIDKGIDYSTFAKEADLILKEIKEVLISQSISIEENFDKLLHIASVSSNSKEIGQMIYDIMVDIGLYGTIEVKESQSTGIKIEKVKGLRINKGFMASQFVTNSTTMEFDQNEVAILIINDRVSAASDIFPFIQAIEDKPILILANDAEHAAIVALIQAKLQTGYPIMLVENDGFGDRKEEMMYDIAAMTGSTVITREDIHSVDPLEVMGFASKVIVNKTTCSIIGGDSDKEKIKTLIDDTLYRANLPDVDPNSKKYYKRRLATLTGGMAVIHVGGATAVEMKETKDRIDDAVEAVTAAVQGGVSIGGGYTWMKTRQNFKDRDGLTKSSKIIIDAMMYVVQQLFENGDQLNVFEKWINKDEVKPFDLISGKSYDVADYEIYDPTSVLLDSLTNSIAVAKSILSISRAIYNEYDDEFGSKIRGPK